MRTTLSSLVVLALAACSGTSAHGTTEAVPAADATAEPQEPERPISVHPEGAPPPTMAALAAYGRAHPVDRTDATWRTHVPAPPPDLPFGPGASCEWLLQTDRGLLRIRLRPETAPRHVASTLWLTSLGFYDGLTFHRVIPGFMAQGGCPLGNGTGGPGYQMDGEFAAAGPTHSRAGVVSMANAGPGTDGSQFFITFVATPHLDGRHTIIGEVVEGEAVLRAIEAIGTRSGRPTATVRIEKAEFVVR